MDIRDGFYQATGALSRNRAFRTLHRRLYEFTSGGGIAGRSLGVETVLLTVTGRRSGRQRTVPLYAFSASDVAGPGAWAVVATNGGAQPAPGWYLDLLETPRAIVQHRSASWAVVARGASPAEAEALWPRIVAPYPGYEGYRRRRRLGAPVVLLLPGRSGAGGSGSGG